MGTELSNTLRAILKDNRSGSTGLALKILDLYSSIPAREDKFARRAHDKIIEQHAGMGLVRNVAIKLQGQFRKDPEGIPEVVEKLKKRIRNEAEKTVKNSRTALPSNASICTISNSSLVRKSILANRDRIREVFVLESRPMLEGRVMATALDKEKIPYTVVVDSALSLVSDSCDIALLGSDSVLSDKSLVHKIGTYPLSLAMKSAGKKIISLTTDLKFEPSFDRSNYPDFKTHPAREIAPRGIRSTNVYFDITPPSYISLYISNTGLFQP